MSLLPAIRRASQCAAILAAGGIFWTNCAVAALGDTSATIDQDALQLRAQKRAAPSSAANYTVHELQLPSGTLVHEYLNTGNQVFAVTWQGPNIPDLQQLLGSYYLRYSTAVQAHGRSRAPVAVLSPDFVIHSAGHARAFHGMAYLPQQFPAGFTVQQIQ